MKSHPFLLLPSHTNSHSLRGNGKKEKETEGKTESESEKKGKTVIEAFPDSAQAQVYFDLADKIQKNSAKNVEYFRPLSSSQIRAIVSQFYSKVKDAENY